MSEPLHIPPISVEERVRLLLDDLAMSIYEAQQIAEGLYAADMEEIYRLAQLGETLHAQIDELAAWIIENIPGEPSQSEGAVECAIRIMAIQKEAINESVKLTVRQAEDLQRAREAYIAATNPGIDMDEVRRTRTISREGS